MNNQDPTLKQRRFEYALQVIRPGWDLSIQLLPFTEEEVTALEGYLLRVHLTGTLELV